MDTIHSPGYQHFSSEKSSGKSDSISIEEQLEEVHYKWNKESASIRKVIESERDLRHTLDLLDLYLSRRFTNAEIDWLNENGILYWLLDGSIFPRYNRRLVITTGNNSELCKIIKICPQNQKSENIGVAA